MTLSREINAVIIISMITLCLLNALLSFYSVNEVSQEELSNIKKLLINERMAKLKDLVDNAYSVLETATFYETAQRALSEMRFGENRSNYFFVFDIDGLFWVNPSKENLVGRVQLDLKDSMGRSYIQKMVETAKTDGEGFIKYKEIKPATSRPETKLTYFKLFKKWNWVLCTGIYIDDIDTLLLKKQSEIAASFRKNILQISLVLFLILAASITISTRLISKRVVKPLALISKAAEKIGKGKFKNRIIINSNKEINKLANSVERMQNSLEIALSRLRQHKKTLQATKKDSLDFFESPAKENTIHHLKMEVSNK